MIFMFYTNVFEASVKASNVAKAVGWSLAMARFQNRQVSLPIALKELMDFDS